MHERRLLLVLIVPFVFVVVGTTGYRLIEGWPLIDALYMSVITLTTIGFGEVHPMSTAGRVFTMILAFGGIFTLFFAGTEIVRLTVNGELRSLLGRRRMEKAIANLRNHVIVCGFGRMGRLVCEEFARSGVPFVVLERDAARLVDFDLPGGLAMNADATSDEALRQAGVDRARAVVAVVASDADNLFITMSARLLADRIPIVARSEDDSTARKLERAGATRVVSPYSIGGLRVAQAVLRPAVLDFIEVATRSQHLELQIEEVQVPAQGRLVGQSLGDSRLRSDVGIILVAIKRGAGPMEFNPPDAARLGAGDTLIMLGHRDQLDRAEALARGV